MCFSKSSKSKDGLRGSCKTCVALYGKQHRAKHKDRENKRTSIWGKNNIEKRRATTRRSYYKHRQKNINRALKYNKEHPETAKSNHRKWRKKNPSKITALSNKRRYAKMKRTPSWLTEDDYLFMEKFYKESIRLTKETGILHQVDHIVPLQGKNVSGLHVPWNLQVLTAKENREKHHKF
jgi:hypothetical protein